MCPTTTLYSAVDLYAGTIISISKKMPIKKSSHYLFLIVLITLLLSMSGCERKSKYDLIIARFVTIPYDNPKQLISVVNMLQSLDKEKTCNILHNNMKNISANEVDRILYILRVLFVSKDDKPIRFFTLGIPGPDIRPSEDDKNWPLFPLVIRDDIPFLLIEGASYDGLFEPSGYIKYYKEHGKIRGNPLSPSVNPLITADTLIKSSQWIQLISNESIWQQDRLRQLIYIQALRMVETAYPLTDSDWCKLRSDDYNREWHKHIENFSKINVIWDPVINDYKIK